MRKVESVEPSPVTLAFYTYLAGIVGVCVAVLLLACCYHEPDSPSQISASIVEQLPSTTLSINGDCWICALGTNKYYYCFPIYRLIAVYSDMERQETSFVLRDSSQRTLKLSAAETQTLLKSCEGLSR